MRVAFALSISLFLLMGSNSQAQIVRDNAPRFPARRVPPNPQPVSPVMPAMPGTAVPVNPEPYLTTPAMPAVTVPTMPGTPMNSMPAPVYTAPPVMILAMPATPAPYYQAQPTYDPTGGPWPLPNYSLPPLYDNYPELADDPFAMCEGCGKPLHRTRRRPPRDRMRNRIFRQRVNPDANFEIDSVDEEGEFCGPDGCECTCHGHRQGMMPRRDRSHRFHDLDDEEDLMVEDDYELDEECDEDCGGTDFRLHFYLPGLRLPESPLMFAGGSVTATTVIGSGDSFGISTYEFRPKFAFRKYPGLQVNPFVAINSLNGPRRVDLPSNLYDYGVEFRWMNAINKDWSFDLSVAPGYFNDTHYTKGKTLRVVSRALLNWRESDEWIFTFGYIHLARKDVVGLPVVGAIYTPNESTRWELIFPRPRYLRRVHWRDEAEQWFYVGGEFGGGTWGYEIPGGASDLVTYSDLRLVLGLETKGVRGMTTRLEGGFVFNRSLDFESALQPDYRPSNTGFVRVGLSF